MNNILEFIGKYENRLLTPVNGNPVRDRFSSLEKVFDRLKWNNMPEFINIVESGVCRFEHGDLNFSGDGCSSIIFDDYINTFGGSLTSIDISEENCNYTRSKVSNKTKIVCSDSVKFFESIPSDFKINLLYLDSFDVIRENPHPSALHHLCELTAAMKNLIPGSIIVIDDADAFFDGGQTGKAMYIREYFNKLGKEPFFDGYQLCYQL